MYLSDFARRPIIGDIPQGINPTELEEFDDIKRQINNISKVTATVSWKKVHKSAKTLLTHHSKDFRVASYYAVSAAHLDGIKGFIEGLNAILDLTVVYWTTAYPNAEKSNARIGAIDWLTEHGEKRIKRLSVTEDDLPLLEAGHQICLRIEEEMRLHYGIKAPSLGSIRRQFGQWIDDIRDQQQKLLQQPKTNEKQEARPVAQRANSDVSVMIKASEIRTEETAKKLPKQNNVRLRTFTIILVIFSIALAAHFGAKYYQVSSFKSQITGATLDELGPLISQLPRYEEPILESLLPVIISNLDVRLKDWNLRPETVTKADDIEAIFTSLNAVYPSSSAINLLESDFSTKKQQLDDNYLQLSNQFSQARTVFANVIRDDESRQAKRAYQYSNSLFPLLGRIEYAESNQDSAELERSLTIVNTYLYKITQLHQRMNQEPQE